MAEEAMIRKAQRQGKDFAMAQMVHFAVSQKRRPNESSEDIGFV